MTERGAAYDQQRPERPTRQSQLRELRESLGDTKRSYEDLRLQQASRPGSKLSSIREDLRAFSSKNEIEKLKEVREELSVKAPTALKEVSKELHEGILSATSREIKDAFSVKTQQTRRKDTVKINEEDPGMTKEEAQAEQKAMTEELVTILSDPQISAKEKAKRFISRLGVRLKSNLKAYVWTFAANFLKRNGYTIVKFLAMGALSAAIMAFLAPFLAGSSVGALLGYTASTGVTGGWTLLLSGLKAGVINSLPGLGAQIDVDFLKDSEKLAPYLSANLLRHPAIQSLLVKMRVPEPYRTLTAMDILKNLIVNLPLLLSPATTAASSMGLPDDPWTNFAYAKGLQYLLTGGTLLAGQSYKATQALVVKMFEAFSEVPSRTMDIIRNSRVLASTLTKTETVLTNRRTSGQDQPLTPAEVSATRQAIQEDLNNPAVKDTLPRLAEEIMTKTTREFDAKVEAQIKRDPLPDIPLAAIRQRQPIKRVEKEKSENIVWASAENVVRTSALISGAFLVSVLATRNASPETISKLLPEALGETAKTIAQRALVSAQEHINSELLLYQMMSNILGVPRMIQGLAKHLPEPARRRLEELDRQIGETTKGLANEKHPLVREFFSLLVGRRIYSTEEVYKMNRDELMQILKDAGTKFDPLKRQPSLNQLRSAALKLQEENVREVHQMVFRSVMAQMSGAGAALAVKNGLSMLQKGRDVVDYILNNDTLRKAAGLTDLETGALKGQMTHPIQDEPLMVTVPGTLKDEAKDVAKQNGPDWNAAVDGADKIDKFLGAVVPGQVTKEVLTRDQQKDLMAKSQGYENWDAYNKARLDRINRHAERKAEEEDKKKKEREARAKELAEKVEAKKAQQDARALDLYYAEDAKRGKELDDALKKYQEDLEKERIRKRQEDARRKEALTEEERDKERKEYLDRQTAALERARKRQKDRLADQNQRDLDKRKEELREYISQNDQLKDLGFLKYIDQVFDMLKGQDVIRVFADNNYVENPEALINKDLANALDIEMLPLLFFGMKKGADRVEAAALNSATIASVPVVGAIVAGYDEVKRKYNTAADIYDASMFVSSTVGALARSATTENTRAGRLARLLPIGGKSAYLPRIKTMTDVLMQDEKMRAYFESQKINPLEVVSKAFFKHLVWGTTRTEMFGEIAGVMIAGKNAGDAGAATAQGVVDAAKLTADLISKFSDYLPVVG